MRLILLTNTDLNTTKINYLNLLLAYLEPNQYSLDSKRPKGFQRSFVEYMNLREDTEGDNKELIESYELENSLFKEAYDKLAKLPKSLILHCSKPRQGIRYTESNIEFIIAEEDARRKLVN